MFCAVYSTEGDNHSVVKTFGQISLFLSSLITFVIYISSKYTKALQQMKPVEVDGMISVLCSKPSGIFLPSATELAPERGDSWKLTRQGDAAFGIQGAK